MDRGRDLEPLQGSRIRASCGRPAPARGPDARTRTGGDTWQGVDVPLAEETEQYLVRVRQGASILRETFVTGPQWAYELSDQAADGISGAFTLEVAQVSALVGAGRFAQVSAVV